MCVDVLYVYQNQVSIFRLIHRVRFSLGVVDQKEGINVRILLKVMTRLWCSYDRLRELDARVLHLFV